jgi:DNA-binding CsgD family transcriptional regulator
VVALRFDQPGDDVFGAACERATGGNPLLLQQLLGGLALEGATPTRRDAGAISAVGPRVIARSVLGRLGKLPPEATATARAVAILGDGADVATVAALSGQELTDVARITGALAQAEILRSGSPLGFAHPVVGEVVLQDIPAAERQLQHWQAAKLLEDAGASSERVAAQLLAAPPIGEDWAIERLAEAALTATASGAADSAVTYLTRMLAEPLSDERRPNVLLQLGMSEAGTGGPHAIEHLTQAYRTLDSPEARGYAAYALSRSLLFVGEPQRAADLAAEARRDLPDSAADIARIVESAELISVYFGAKVPDAEDRYERLRAMPEDPTGGEAVLAAAASYDWLYRGGTAEECADLAYSAIERAARMEFDTGLTWIVANVVLVAADRPEAMEMWDRALARSHKQGGMFGVMTVHLWRGFTQLRHGELLEAEESLRAGIEQINLLGGATLDYAHGLLATTLIEQGRVDEAERTLYEIDRPEGIGDGALLWRVAEIELLLAKGRAEEALAAAETHAELCGWRINPAFATSLSLKARALDKLGRREEAEEVLELELERAECWGAPGTVGRTLRLLGEIREDRGLADLERAIELLGRSPMKLELGRALAALGAAKRRGRKQSEAREPLRRAYELAEACGADPLTAQARTELHASGARPRSSALSGPASLTASERRVTDLALEGQTNKQIAQALYVTPKTVEVHLSNAYRKLEISSRRELASVLAA